MFTHLWNLLNLGQNLYYKMLMFLLWWMQLGNLKKKTCKVHMNENLIKIFKTLFIWGKKKSILKGLLKIKSNFNISKIHNNHLVKVF